MNKTISSIVIGLLFLSVGVNVYWYYFPRVEKSPGVTVYLPGKSEPTIIYTLPAGNQSSTTKVEQQYQEKTGKAKELLAQVKGIPDLEKEKEITALMAAKMKLELNLSEKDLALNDKEKQIKVWKDKFNSVTVDNVNNTSSVISEVSPKIATTAKRPGIFKPKETYTVITSENPSVKFYGIESYSFKNPKQKDLVELNLKIQGLFVNKTLIPYGGIELLFNPDGKLKPIVGYGYFYDNFSGKLYPYWMAGVQFNLIRL